MQVQAQMNRILRLSQDTGNYRRLRRAVDVVERDRGYRTYSNGWNNLAVITKGQSRAVESRITHRGRINTLNRAASGSVG